MYTDFYIFKSNSKIIEDNNKNKSAFALLHLKWNILIAKAMPNVDVVLSLICPIGKKERKKGGGENAIFGTFQFCM